MAKKPRRIPEEKVFVSRKLSNGVTTLKEAKVPHRDHRGMLQLVRRDIRNVFSHNYSIEAKRW